MVLFHMYVKLFEEYQQGLKDAELDKIKFGYPTSELQEEAEVDCPVKKWFIEKGIAEEIIRKAPANSSKTTVEDLQTVQARMLAVNSDDMIFARNAEESFEQIFIDYLQTKDCHTDMGELQRVIGQVDPITFYLKDKIGRPRPHTLGYYHNIPIRPLIHTDASSASYPSGHASSAFALARYYGEKFSHLAGELEALAQRVADSRIQMGLHHPSDTEAGKYIANLIFKHNLLK